MKVAALVLGILAGLLGMIVGFSVSGYIAFVDWIGPEADVLSRPETADRLKIVGMLAPLMALAGGAMAVLRPFIAAVLLGGAAGLMIWSFGWGLFTTFPILCAGLAAVLALAGAASREPGGMPR